MKKTSSFIYFLTNFQTIGKKLPKTYLTEMIFNVLKDGEEFILKKLDKCGPKKKIKFSLHLWLNNKKVETK